jgi:hypothetical protein
MNRRKTKINQGQRFSRKEKGVKKEDIEKTEWAINFKKKAPTAYQEAIELALNPDLSVSIYQNTEIGENLWAINAFIGEEDTLFWLDAKKTQKEAVRLCNEMGWKIFEIVKMLKTD